MAADDVSSEGFHMTSEQLQKVNVAIGLFRGWLTSENLPTSFEKFSPSRLNDVLEQFYSDFKSMHAGPFNINKLGDVREGLFTYLKGVNSTWKNYLSHPAHTQKYKVNEVKRKVSMSGDDVRRLMNSGVLDIDTPLGLFRKVWLDLAIHLGIGGQAAMRSLTFDSFVAETDDKGRRYYRLNRDGVDRQQARSCMEMQYWNWEGKMYEISNDRLCPVKSMDRYYERRNMMRESFFQRPKTSVHHLETSWFESPVGHSVLACLLTKMSEESMLQKSYTNSSLKITLADFLEAEGYDVEELLGVHPRNKTTRNYRANLRKLTADELCHNSFVIHNALYRFVEDRQEAPQKT